MLCFESEDIADFDEGQVGFSQAESETQSGSQIALASRQTEERTHQFSAENGRAGKGRGDFGREVQVSREELHLRRSLAHSNDALGRETPEDQRRISDAAFRVLSDKVRLLPILLLLAQFALQPPLDEKVRSLLASAPRLPALDRVQGKRHEGIHSRLHPTQHQIRQERK